MSSQTSHRICVLLTEWSTLIGRDPLRYCALIGWIIMLLMPALLCHKDTAQGTQSPLLGAFLAFHCVFMREEWLPCNCVSDSFVSCLYVNLRPLQWTTLPLDCLPPHTMVFSMSPHIVCSILAWARVPTERARLFLGEKTSAVMDSAELEP